MVLCRGRLSQAENRNWHHKGIQAAASGLTNVVPCVTARCACNRHPARERRQGRCALILLLPEWLLVWSPRGPLWCRSLRDF